MKNGSDISFFLTDSIIFIQQERRKVEGKCGGSCAMCRQVRGLKLDMLPP